METKEWKEDIKQERDGFVDFLKAVLIFIVIWSHCISALNGEILPWNNNYFSITTTTFQMPFFILISGYLFYASTKRQSYQKIIKKKASTVLVPIVIWNTIFFIASTLVSIIRNSSSGSIISNYFYYMFHSLWYLWVYLLISIIMCLVGLIIRRESIRIIIYIVIEIGAHFLFEYVFYFEFMFPFFLVGYYIAKNGEKLKGKVRTTILIVLAIVYPILRLFYIPEYSIYMLPSKMNLVEWVYFIKAYAIRFLAGISGTACCYLLARILWKSSEIIRESKNIRLVGKRTMELYILHSFIVSFLIKKVVAFLKLNEFFVERLFITNFVFALLLAVFVLIGCLLITKAIYKIPKIGSIVFGIKKTVNKKVE